MGTNCTRNKSRVGSYLTPKALRTPIAAGHGECKFENASFSFANSIILNASGYAAVRSRDFSARRLARLPRETLPFFSSRGENTLARVVLIEGNLWRCKDENVDREKERCKESVVMNACLFYEACYGYAVVLWNL